MTEENSNINFNNIFLSSELINNTSECQNVIQTHPVALKAVTETLVQAIEPLFIRLTTEVTSMREEIKYPRNEVKALKKEKLLKFVMPDIAFKEMDDFLKFEKQLEDDNNFFLTFGTELLSVAKAPNFTKNCWRKILTDKVAEKLCWKGTENKKSVRSLSVAKAIRNATVSVGLNEEDFVKSTKSFFQFAKNRLESKKKYVPKSKKIEV